MGISHCRRASRHLSECPDSPSLFFLTEKTPNTIFYLVVSPLAGERIPHQANDALLVCASLRDSPKVARPPYCCSSAAEHPVTSGVSTRSTRVQ